MRVWDVEKSSYTLVYTKYRGWEINILQVCNEISPHYLYPVCVCCVIITDPNKNRERYISVGRSHRKSGETNLEVIWQSMDREIPSFSSICFHFLDGVFLIWSACLLFTLYFPLPSPMTLLWTQTLSACISAKTQWRNGTVKSQVLISCEFYKFCSVKISKGVWVEHRVGGISTISHFNAADSDSKMAGKSIKLKWSIKKIITLI